MSTLAVKLRRDLFQMWPQALAIAVVIACGVATLVMSLSTIRSLQNAQDAYYDRYRFAHVFARLKRAPQSLAARIAEIPGVGNAKINAAFANGGAELQVRAVEHLLGIEINHVAIVDFGGFRDFIDAIGGVKVKLPMKVCSSISGGTYNVRLTAGEHTLNGEKALALARTRQQNGFVDSDGDGAPDADQPKACQNPPPIDDLDRTRFQQLILQGVKDRLTDPWRIPRNFIFGPWIGWNAPKAFVSDMGALTLPQLAFAAVFGGSSKTTVLRPSGPGPEGSLFVPQENCARAVRRLTGNAPDEPPACSPAG